MDSSPSSNHPVKMSQHDTDTFRSSTPTGTFKVVPVDQLTQLANTLPSNCQSILKCNQCDHLTETKHDMEQHFDMIHPNNSDCNSVVLPSVAAALMAAAQINYGEKMIKQEHGVKKSSILIDDDDELNGSKIGEADIMTIEPDIDGVMINNSSRSSSSVSMLHPDDIDDKSTGAMRTTPSKLKQHSSLSSVSPFSASSVNTIIDDYSVMCPLCQDSFSDKKSLEQHVMGIHSVNADGLNRLLQLVDTSHWLNKNKCPDVTTTTGNIINYECTMCNDTLKTLNDLLLHATEHQHYTTNNLGQYSCLLKKCTQLSSGIPQLQQHFRDSHLNIVISERHVYKYRCKLCSLAFKTQEKLNNHAMYHTMRDATKCNVCNRNFRSTNSLQRHMEQVHGAAQPNSLVELIKPTDCTDDERIQSPHEDEDFQLDGDHEVTELDEYLNSDQVAEEHYTSNRKYKCTKCHMAFTHAVFLNQHYKSNIHRRNEKGTSYPMEKYLDPNRPFKCDICRESFTQKNILLVHYNSVSHLHKLKKQQNEPHSGSSTPALCTSPSQLNDSIEYDRKSVDYEMEISSVGESNKRKLSSDTDYDSPKKRFKCDICKVAYAQGSTLDIHMRSVLHQTRSCRMQEQQQQKIQTPGGLITGTSPTLPGSQQTQEQQQQQQQQQQQNNGSISPQLANNHMYKTLLENFGFDIVKQFNDQMMGAGGAVKSTTLPLPKKNGVEEDRYYCRHCKKVFSSIFVLQTHSEEVHNEKIPVELLEKFAETFKNYLEKDADSEVLDFSSKPTAADIQVTDPMKLFTPEILQAQQQQLAQLHEQKLDPALVAQRMMEQQFLAQFPQISQSLQNLSGGNMPLNTLEMLNLMQFHHFMSLNFMNLAPPLIFGAGQQSTSGNQQPPTTSTTPTLTTQKSSSDVVSPSPVQQSTPSMLQQQQNSANQMSQVCL